MIELAVDSLAPLPGVMTLVVVAFTVSGLVLKVTVGALSVPPTVMTSRALAAEVSVLPEPHAAKNTKGMTAADTARKRGRRTRRPRSLVMDFPNHHIATIWVSPNRTVAALTHMLEMSRSTRASTAANGSLHRTVRWAWSLSLRCTQSTVKSLLCS